ncbi:hypothetical protein K2173_028458 [Erythroxylum novogranatense]|uniref:Uncharacterized protein n=1 Tax=Erythroxylum novogranatense TaxID=1862640 RepID=A0AAV8U382_9ROSI|nr:hypothetical protein K2173_028458 [Erythroxylum novogranatense]
MKKKGHSQNKFVRILTLPLKVLGKAKDFYVRSLTNCSMSVSHRHGMTLPDGQFSSLPRSFSVGSLRPDVGEDYRELVRAASVRSLGHKSEMEMYRQQLRQSSNVGSEILPKSSTVCMGRIDEDKACDDFEEVGEKREVYPRSRSYAVAKPSVVF